MLNVRNTYTYLIEYKAPKEAESALLFDRTSFYSSPIIVELFRGSIAGVEPLWSKAY